MMLQRGRAGRLGTAGIGILVLALSAAPGLAQDTVTPFPLPQQQSSLPSPGAPNATVFSHAELASMLAPIALYPDPLLSQILMAATYPAEVVEADRWAHDPSNAGLKGDALAAALAPIDWDPSVKSLVPFPQILATLDQRLDWTQQIGQAFVAQQGDVMDTIQTLRRQAAAAGTLRSGPQLSVVPQGDAILIEPTNPEMVYVPVYEPAVYGMWLYPAVPPLEISPAPVYYPGPIAFTAGFVVVRSFWGWSRCDWHQHRVFVDPPRVNAINAFFIQRGRAPALQRSAWQVDPHHQHVLPDHVGVGRAFEGPRTHPGTAPARPATSGLTTVPHGPAAAPRPNPIAPASPPARRPPFDPPRAAPGPASEPPRANPHFEPHVAAPSRPMPPSRPVAPHIEARPAPHMEAHPAAPPSIAHAPPPRAAPPQHNQSNDRRS